MGRVLKKSSVIYLMGIVLFLLAVGLSKEASAEWGDLVLDKQYESMKKAGVDKVVFPHWFHRIRFKCKTCHEGIFEMEKGKNNIQMSGIIRGNFCGKCHNGKIAFAPVACARCHSYKEPKKVELAPVIIPKARRGAGDTISEGSGDEDEDEGINPYLRKIDALPSNSPLFLTSAGELGSTGGADALASRAARIGAGEHPQALEVAGLPKDKFGLIDWAKMIKQGLISPRPSIDPKRQTDIIIDMSVLFETKSDFIENVLYPHDIHTYWLDCRSCHTRIFNPKKGSNPVLMTEISEGKWCGWCHGKVAFPLDDCTRCHTQPKPGQ
jgi:c(7)-type cytochrome triheme protein